MGKHHHGKRHDPLQVQILWLRQGTEEVGMTLRRFNPWLRIKDLLADMDELEYRIRQAERVAYEKAHIHFDERTRDLQRMNAHLLSQMAEISALQPMPTLIIKDKTL